jgi:hypothetical protein
MRARRAWGPVLFLLILALGLWLRGHELSATPPTGDESESAINALTILQTGVPRGEYVGLPIYENVLTEPWPGNAEYEFRDSSYSNKGLAIYHGWLPLYTMAASFKAFGVTPDEPLPGELRVRHDDFEVRRRVVAARLPSIVFGGLFLVFLFLAGFEMAGTDAAFAAMLVGAIGRPFVFMGREARYHAATMALSTACCWAIWRVYKYGRWTDYLVAALCLVLLFYTHLLAFSVACLMFAAVMPAAVTRGGRGAIVKLIACGVIVSAATTPWLIASGFLAQRAHIPPARALLTMPLDLIWYPLLNIPYLLLPLAVLIWLWIAYALRRQLPARIVDPLREHRRAILFLLGWIAVGMLAFTFLIPAASYFYKRLTLAVMGPGVVWGAVVASATARAWRPGWSALVAPAAFALAVAAGNMADLWFFEKPDPLDAYVAVDRLRQTNLAPDTKIYCTPNDQLSLTFLAGLPVQSVAPVRKCFFDTYPGPMLIIDSTRPYGMLQPDEVQAIAAQHDYAMSQAEAVRLAAPMVVTMMYDELRARGTNVDPVGDEPPLAAEAATYLRERVRRQLEAFRRRGCNTPLLRGYELRTWADWWPLFFYRFVGPEARMGNKLNYADRIKSARAEILPTAWVFYHCPPLSP